MATKRPLSSDENIPKVKAKKTRKQVYLADYAERFPGVIKASGMGPHYAYCEICSSVFSIAASGVYDISVHINGKRHIEKSKNRDKLPRITNFFGKPMTDDEHKVSTSELLFTRFLVEHNIAMEAGTHFTKLLPKLCPDSEIAKKFTCGRTKATALVNFMGENVQNEIVQCIKDKPYSISSDGSNDQSDKFYPLVITFVNDSGEIKHGLDVPTVEESTCTGQNIFNVISSSLSKYGLNLSKCLAFGADNANVMSGTKSGVIGFIRKDNPHVHFSGCPCHLIHLAAKYASDQLSTPVASRLIDIFYYLKHSAKRQNELSLLKERYGIKDLKVLKYCPTRWLSMRQCISRLLELWSPLRDFFENEQPKAGKETSSDKTTPESFERCVSFLKSHTAKATCLFLCHALDSFDKYNMALQYDKPEIHKVRDILHALLREVLVKFIKPAAFKSGSILEINPGTTYNHKSDADIVIGAQCKAYVVEKKFGDSKSKKFVNECRNFYIKAATYMATKLPMKDPLLQHATVFDLSKLSVKSFQSVKYFTDKYPFLLDNTSITMDKLEDQFTNLQVEELSPTLLAEKDAGKQWSALLSIKDPTGQPKYGDLVTLARYILCIPHSNAMCERIFSHVRHIRTDARPTMKKQTLSALCVLKECSTVPCYELEFSKETAKEAKSATSKFLSAWSRVKVRPMY